MKYTVKELIEALVNNEPGYSLVWDEQPPEILQFAFIGEAT
jgi:hypothetical protein